MKNYDAVVVGAGPNGLAAAITLARKGHAVLVLEAKKTIGGGTRSEMLTEPGFMHDVCSAVHPLALASPFFQQLPLHEHGLTFVHPDFPFAHPLEKGRAVVFETSLHNTAQQVGKDGEAYLKIFSTLHANAESIFNELIGPLRFPKHPFLALRFAYYALRSAQSLVDSHFRGEEAKALWAGLAAHAILPLSKPISSAAALTLGLAGHAYGWPFARGGSQSIAYAMASYLHSLGGEIEVDCKVSSLREIPACRWIFFDLSPQQIVHVEGLELSTHVRKQLEQFRHGPGIFKIDWALREPIPWLNQSCTRAGTIHVGGTSSEIAASEQAVWNGSISENPFTILAQPSLFDPTRAPRGKHTAWAYCHVPQGSLIDCTERIERQIETYAPGFKDCVLARHVMNTHDMERYNGNYNRGDISGGVSDISQLFTRPLFKLNPYRIAKNVFICSASTPPGAGVHGLCGYYAALSAS